MPDSSPRPAEPQTKSTPAPRPEQITGDCTDCYDVGYVLESSGDREYWKPCHCDRGMAYDSAFDLQPRARAALQNAYLDIRSLRAALAEKDERNG